MPELIVATTNGADAVLEQTGIEAFQASLRGELLREGDAAYDDARRIFNGMIDRRPALIARCAGVADVRTAIDFARDNDLLVSVHGGGHGVAGFAVCEGGGNFGIVTSFEYRLHPVGPVLGGLLIYPFEQARRLLRFYHEFTSTAPDELGSLAVIATLPDGTKAVVFLLGYNGPVDEGERVLRPLRTFGTPMADQIGSLPYTALQSIVENFNPAGLRNYWKMSYLKELDDAAIDLMVERYASVPAPHTHIVLYTLGGAVSRVGRDETSVAYRDARHAFLVVGMWSDHGEDDTDIRWVRDLWGAMRPHSSGGFYVNYETDMVRDRVEAAYGSEIYERLVALKSKYDPENFFRLNQNIEPAM